MDILEKVKPHLPTIDFDSSSSENEEIVTVYQRPAGLSLTVPEDFHLFSTDDDDLEELLTPVAQRCWSEESGQLDADEHVEGTTVTGTHRSDADADAEADACDRGIVQLNRAKPDASVPPNVDDTTADGGFPVLSFARLDQWDLDDVLKNLDGLPLQQYASVEPLKTHAGVKNRSQGNIMERLVAFCNSQSSKSVSEPVKSPNHIRYNNVWKKSSVWLEDELQLSQQECPTVYIDLRCPDSSIKPPRASSNPSSESKSAAKHNNHQETPPAKKLNLKAHAGSRKGDREATGKSMLLQKIREMNRNGNRYPNEYADPTYSVPENVPEKLKEKLPRAGESTCRHESHNVWGDRQSSHVQFENRTIREPKQHSDHQRARVKQTYQQEQHQQILKQLEIHRPSKSVNQKQPAAESTDVLYDFEASHLQWISTLPADIESKRRVLLTVDLSSPGVVGSRAHRKRKHLDSAATKSDIYNTLVAWFLSLVGPEPRHEEDEVGAKVPFWVAGLQQLWTEDGLALHVLVVARHSYKPRKSEKDIHTPFYNHVCRFLTETSLALITSWLPRLRNLLDQQAYASPIHLPSSCLDCFISTTSNEKVIDRTFGLSPGFYWQTVETQEHVCKGRETTQELHTEVSVALGCKAFILHPVITHYALQLVLDSGLDVCGLRLLYPPQGFLSDSAGAVPVIQRTEETCQPVLALAVRGLHAHSVLKDLTSSLDPLMPRETDRHPLQPPLFFSSSRLASRVHRELCLWFSGRVGGQSAQTHNRLLNRVVPLNDRSGVFLCATTKADLLLVVSPAVPPCCYGQVLSVCERRGFSLSGLQRPQLQSNAAAVLGLSKQQARVFCSPQTVTPDQGHCLLLLLRKENAVHHGVSLPAALMREFKAQQLLGCIQSRVDGVQTAEPSFCFHTVPYSGSLCRVFVRCMWAVPDPSSVILSHQKCSSNSDMEQVAILTFCGKDMRQGLSLLHRALTEEPEGFELLGLKWLPALTRLQAQELSPYEVGQQLCQDSLNYLMPSPALVCALKRLDAFPSLRKLLPLDYPGNLSVLMSPTPEVAFRQASLFFFEHEMIPDHSVRPVVKFPPQNCSTKGILNVHHGLRSDPQMLVTVCLFKPTIWNHTLAKIACELQLCGLTMVGLHVVILDKSTATSLLPAESDPSVLEAHVEYLTSGSSLALCLQGENAASRLLDVLDQEDSSLWTYHGMAHSHNGIYASGSYQKAIQDVRRFFPEGLCCTETSTMRREQVRLSHTFHSRLTEDKHSALVLASLLQIPSVRSDPLASAERERSCTFPVDRGSASPLRASGPNRGIHSALWQTTCLLLPLNAPPLSRVVPALLAMLEQLLRSGCHLVAGRMSTLDTEQRKHIAETLKVSSRGNQRMAHLYSAPCLIMALQGEAIVAGFNSILESIYKERSELEEVGEMIIYPECQKEAQQLIRYLFDHM
ncbi:dynein axonemal assembly factor 8 isoform X2 [Cebidichthys violaceus]|uniref:dynein axonemal assembly factor 8 isoform X2 n=1 Tax=Cebidichthys violaceus TaxID=271503 RepID=UPI0035CB0373